MKKVLTLALAALMLLSALSLTACGKTESLKLGLGVSASYEKASDADGDTNGEGEVVVTAAAVLVDANGKIVKCVIDTADNTVGYTSDGKYVAADSFQTKYEKGEAYGMKAYAGSAKEWYEQADAFAALTVGKTADEVKALVADGGKGTDAVISAGCTIAVSDFANAVVKAVANAADSSATKDDTLKIAMVSKQASSKDATDEAEGVNEVDTTIVAAALDKNNKVTACKADALQATFTFDAKGVATLDTATAIQTKNEKGDAYGMKAYAGSAKEWYEQADAFCAACVGKTSAEIAALAVGDGYGVESLQTAGCTIGVTDLVETAVKAAK